MKNLALVFLMILGFSLNANATLITFATNDIDEMIQKIEEQDASRYLKDLVIYHIIEKGLGQISFMSNYPPIGNMTCTAGNYRQNTSCINVPTLYGGKYALRGCTLACVGTTVTYFCEDAIACL